MNGADGIQPTVNVTYRETRPGRVFRNYSIRVSQQNEWNHGWNRQTGTRRLHGQRDVAELLDLVASR